MKNKAHASRLHARWHRIVEGQIMHTIGRHPEYFTADRKRHDWLVNSLAKRIVGEIVAAFEVATIPCAVESPAARGPADSAAKVQSAQPGGGKQLPPGALHGLVS